MSYEINADRYAFAQTPEPDKVNENYNAVLIRKLIQEEANNREELKNVLEQNLANEVYARTDGDIELESRMATEKLLRENAVSELSMRLYHEAEQRQAADDFVLQTVKTKENKVTVITVTDENTDGSYSWNGPDNHNTDTRILTPALDTLYIEWWDGEYPEDYCASLSFNSGQVPTTISYPMGGIINWVGTDCVLYDGISIFRPAANTHYEVVMYYNGIQCIGMVNGFVPSTQEVDYN